MKILVIGSGGREHALGFKLKEASNSNEIYFAPGNAGTSQLGENVAIDISDFNQITKFCKKEHIDLVVVGPEKPLVDGLADFLRENGITVFGPNKNAASIEGSKSFAKDFMKRHKIPTAEYKIFTKDEKEIALYYLNKSKYPVVLKADGLAAGKGVVICNNFDEAKKEIEEYFTHSKFGKAGEKIVIEEFLEGNELSVFVITDGNSYVILTPAQDYKRVFDGNKGPNTGGMGAYAPVNFISEQDLKEIEDNIVIPTINGMKEENRIFSGCLYCGLIKTESGIKVIEYNARFGDPETQAVLELIDGRFDMLLLSAAQGTLDKDSVKFLNKFAVAVVVASGGYPGKYEKGKVISGLNNIDEDVKIIHAGTKMENGKITTSGGRVLALVNSANSLNDAKNKIYTNLEKIHFDGMFYRKDIPQF